MRAVQVSLPMLAPLLVGTGMLLRTVMSNASFIFPRVGLMVIMTWGLWFTNRVIQNTAVYLRRQVRMHQQHAAQALHASSHARGGMLKILTLHACMQPDGPLLRMECQLSRVMRYHCMLVSSHVLAWELQSMT